MEIKYCITCEEDVIVSGEDVHLVEGQTPDDWKVCDGVLTSVQPPVNFEIDWDLQVIEPTQEEMAIMNLHAEELMQDFDYTDLKF